MTAEEFNELTKRYAQESLYPLGFKQAGVHFYIHQPPTVMVFYKKTARVMFEGFYLAITHDFLSGMVDKKGKLKNTGLLRILSLFNSNSSLKRAIYTT